MLNPLYNQPVHTVALLVDIEAVSCKRYKLACTPIEDADQPTHPRRQMSLRWALDGLPRVQSFFRQKTKTLISLLGCSDWFEYSLYAYANLYAILDTGSKFCSFAGIQTNYNWL